MKLVPHLAYNNDNKYFTTNSELSGALWIMAEESHYVVCNHTIQCLNQWVKFIGRKKGFLSNLMWTVTNLESYYIWQWQRGHLIK